MMTIQAARRVLVLDDEHVIANTLAPYPQSQRF